MKYIYFALFFSVTTLSFGIDFFEGSWEEAKLKAKSENKILFVDAYTTWCGPCKVMSARVFPEPVVADFYNHNFVNVKLDMEKGEGRDFSRQYSVSAYPTLLYIFPDGKVAHKKIGGCDPQQLVAIGKQVLKSANNEEAMTKIYEESSSHTSAFILSYLKELRKANKFTAKVANEYLRDNPNIPADSLALISYEGLQDADSKLFDYVLENWDYLKSVYGEDVMKERINRIYRKSLILAMEFDAPNLLDPIGKADKVFGTSEMHRLKRIYHFRKGNWNEFEAEINALNKNDGEEVLSALALIDPVNTEWPFEIEDLKNIWTDLSKPAIEHSKDPATVNMVLSGLKKLGLEKELKNSIKVIEKNLKKEVYGENQPDVESLISQFS